MAGVSIQAVSKSFGAVRALDRISMAIESGEFVALLGPSGCGKTSLLRLLAGFEEVDEGMISVDGQIMSAPGCHVPPERRRIGMVFQSYALWPHMSVAENVAYALKVRQIPGRERDRIVGEALAVVGLTAMAARRPAALSGGQRQRVALARCLAMSPRLMLLDEPLSNLDPHLRETMQAEFKTFHRQAGATMVYVTHDQAEALALADRVAVIMHGRIRQFDTPETLYRHPADIDVARFIGAGLVVPGRAIGMIDGDHCPVELLGVTTVLLCAGRPNGAVSICLRPEDLAIAEAGDPAIQARVVSTTYRGAWHAIDLAPACAPESILRIHCAHAPPAIGDTLFIAIRSGWVVPSSGH